MKGKVFLLGSYSLSAFHSDGSIRENIINGSDESVISNTSIVKVGGEFHNYSHRIASIDSRLTMSWPQRKISKMLGRKDILAIECIVKVLEKFEAIRTTPAFTKGVFSAVSDSFLRELFNYAHIFSSDINLDTGEYDQVSVTDNFLNSINPMSIPKFLHNNTTCFGSYFSEAMGENAAIADGETSGAELFGLACRSLRSHHLDYAIVGAASIGIEPFRLASCASSANGNNSGGNQDFFNESSSFSILSNEVGLKRLVKSGVQLDNIIELVDQRSTILGAGRANDECLPYLEALLDEDPGFCKEISLVVSDAVSSRSHISAHTNKLCNLFNLPIEKVISPRFIFGYSNEAQFSLSMAYLQDILSFARRANEVGFSIDKPSYGLLLSSNENGKVIVTKYLIHPASGCGDSAK